MMRILCARHFFPWPPVSGGNRVAFSTLRELCRGGEVDLLCFGHDVKSESIKELRQNCPGLRNVFIVPHYRKPRYWAPLMNATGKSYFLSRDYSREYVKKAQQLVRGGNYDFFFSDTLRVFVNVAEVFSARRRGLPWVAQFHNVEHLLFRSFLDRRPFVSMLLRPEAELLKRREIRYWKLPDRAIFISPEDYRKAMKATAQWPKLTAAFPGEMIALNPIGWRGGGEGRICHLGTGSWEPNIDGVKWFLKSVFPLIRKEFPAAVFSHAGQGTDSRLTRFHNGNNVCIQGFVSDLTEFYLDAALFVAPLRFGSGIKIKVIDAISRGVPVVMSSVAAEGLPLVEGEGVFVADDPRNFADKVLMLLRDPELRIRQGQLAYAAAEKMAGMSRRDILFFRDSRV
ncbi:MAG: glycosyltransferase [Acidobacteria bacterium]|nr:glycosyltransferase [Acidobacteriota bacterium]